MSGPVITFLSKSPSASRKTLALLGQLSNNGLERINTHNDNNTWNNKNDILNDSSSVPLFLKWDSVASRCRETGTILHLLSIDYNDNSNDDTIASDEEKMQQNLSLLAITPPSVSSLSTDSLKLARDALASHIREQMSNPTSTPTTSLQYYYHGVKLYTMWKLGIQITSEYILGPQNNGLPILQFPNPNNISVRNVHNSIKNEKEKDTSGLSSSSVREIVIPHLNNAKYSHNGSSLLNELASNMHRPLTGLYQWKTQENSDQNVFFRPLPTSDQDLVLSSPTIVFRFNHDLNEIIQKKEDINIQCDKIGFNGGKNGQILIQHESLTGLDVRFCNSPDLSSTFAESQESLLAGSLQELQSAHVLTEGSNNNHNNMNNVDQEKNTSNVRSDKMNGLGDCWVEFRANIKRPTGFFKQMKQAANKMNLTNTSTTKTTSNSRIVKAPNIPYE